MDSCTDILYHFNTPFNMVVAGPSQVGKTTFVHRLLQRRPDAIGAIVPRPDRIKYVYGVTQPTLQDLTTSMQQQHGDVRFELHEGWSPNLIDDFNPRENNVIVLDDVMQECKNDVEVSNLFTRGGHHKNISIILLSQNYFFSGKSAIDIRRNTHYLVLFSCKQDRRQISSFAQRVLPTRWRDMLTAYEDATSEAHGHLLIDMNVHCPDRYMLRARTIEDAPVFYVL